MLDFETSAIAARAAHYLRPDADRRLRPDHARFAPPAGTNVASAEPSFQDEAKSAPPESLAAWLPALRVAAGLARLRRELRDLHRLVARKANFNPAQPRDERGRWTDSSGDENGDDATVQRVAARGGRAGPLGLLVTAVETLAAIKREMEAEAHRDPPKSLEELQTDVAHPRWGYQIHHIVEQASAEQAGFPRSMIDAPENLVWIPTWKHYDINGWSATPNRKYGGLSPREFLRDADWETRLRVGKDALIDHGVLKR